MTHGAPTQPARTAAKVALERPLGLRLTRGQKAMVVGVVALAAAVFVLTFALTRGGRAEPSPDAKNPATQPLPPPTAVQQPRATAALPALGKAPNVPDLKRTPEPTASGGSTAGGTGGGAATGGGPTGGAATGGAPTGGAPPSGAPATGGGAPATGGGAPAAGGAPPGGATGSGDGGVICSPC